MGTEQKYKENWGDKSWNEKKFTGDLDSEGDSWGMRWRGMDRWRHSLYLSVMKDRLHADKPLDVLDIGCALCDFTEKVYWVNGNNYIYAMDVVDRAIEWSRKKFPMFKFAVGGIPDIAFEKNFDIIMCVEVLCYLPHDGRRQTVENIYSRLNEGGTLLFAGCLDGGSRHHTEAEIRSYTEPYFDIERVIYHHWYVYRTFYEEPLNRIRDFCQRFSEQLKLSREDFASWVLGKGGAKISVIKLLHGIKPVSTLCLDSVAAIAKAMLGWRFVASFLHHITRFRGPSKADEIIIVARRRGGN